MKAMLIFEERIDEITRTFNDNLCGTIRTTDGGGDKRVLVIEVNNEPDHNNWQPRRV